jgi:hypothetical protein
MLKSALGEEGETSGEKKGDDVEQSERAGVEGGAVIGECEVGLTPAAIWYQVKTLEVMLE